MNGMTIGNNSYGMFDGRPLDSYARPKYVIVIKNTGRLDEIKNTVMSFFNILQ